LEGEMEEAKSRRNGFNTDIIELFKNGFPSQWKNSLIKHRRQLRSERSLKNDETSDNSQSDQSEKNSEISIPSDVVVELDIINETPKFVEGRSIREKLNSLTKTRSGRRVLPPLAFWRGQTVVRDARGNTIGMLEGSPDAISSEKKGFVVPQEIANEFFNKGALSYSDEETPVHKHKNSGVETKKTTKSRNEVSEDIKQAKKKFKNKKKTDETSEIRKNKGETLNKKNSKQNNDSDNGSIFIELKPRQKKGYKDSEEESEDESGWTKRDLVLLEEAVRMTNPDKPHYWKRIADVVGRSEEECYDKYNVNYKTPGKPSHSKRIVEESPLHLDPKTGKLFAGRLKDKKKIRKIVSDMNDKHTDDFFDSTPGKKTENFDVYITDDETIKEIIDTNPAVKDVQTPSSLKQSPGLFKKLDTKQRTEVDSYVNQLKKRKQPQVFVFEEKKNTKKKKSKADNQDLTVIREITTTNKSESDEESKDYYYSE